MRSGFRHSPGGFRDFMTIQHHALEIHIEGGRIINDQIVTFTMPFQLIRHLFRLTLNGRWTVKQFDARINRNLQRIHPLNVLR